MARILINGNQANQNEGEKMKTETNYTNIPKNETQEERLVRHTRYLLRELEIWFTPIGKNRVANFPSSLHATYHGVISAISETEKKRAASNRL